MKALPGWVQARPTTHIQECNNSGKTRTQQSDTNTKLSNSNDKKRTTVIEGLNNNTTKTVYFV